MSRPEQPGAALRSSAPGRAAWRPRSPRTGPGSTSRSTSATREVKAAGNILNLWPPPQKVLRLIGVDIEDLGAPANADLPPPRRAACAPTCGCRDEVIAEYGGGFIGLLRPGLYQRMLDALPERRCCSSGTR